MKADSFDAVTTSAIKGIKAMRAAGKSWRAIGMCMGVHHTTAMRFAARHGVTETVPVFEVDPNAATFWLEDGDGSILTVYGNIGQAAYAAEVLVRVFNIKHSTYGDSERVVIARSVVKSSWQDWNGSKDLNARIAAALASRMAQR